MYEKELIPQLWKDTDLEGLLCSEILWKIISRICFFSLCQITVGPLRPSFKKVKKDINEMSDRLGAELSFLIRYLHFHCILMDMCFNREEKKKLSGLDNKLPYFSMCNVLLCIVCAQVFGLHFQEKNLSF